METKSHIIAIAGNPNVGKSTIFNALTGLNQHTGNWIGKTVTNAKGYCHSSRRDYLMVDLPGTYSLLAHSAEEETARNFLCFEQPDAVLIVCDATCLERNLNLVLQILEITPKAMVCVNLMDEAAKKHIRIDLKNLSGQLGVPVVGTNARDKKSISQLLDTLDSLEHPSTVRSVTYSDILESALSILVPVLENYYLKGVNPRWLGIKLLDCDENFKQELTSFLNLNLWKQSEVSSALSKTWTLLKKQQLGEDTLKDQVVASLVLTAEQICQNVVSLDYENYNKKDRMLDQIFTSKWTGYPLMFLLFLGIFWLTITGANYPSQLLSQGLFWIEKQLTELFIWLHAPDWLNGVLIQGAYRVLAWVVSVMLPPMAIFFPLFTLLEDSGYLPRIAYNLDKPFQCCHSCGKQSLTMCMGFGCNAAGVTGCRIIDSPRERLIAILTNNFVPCNGRFPTLIALITMFFVGTSASIGSGFLSAAILTLFIVLGILVTFGISALLSHTLLKGVPSSFTLELPPYRRPQFGKVIVRSIFDRTLFVLGRAAAVAAPAGILLWIMANVCIGEQSLLHLCAAFLDPFARLLGLDGVILTAFILGLPANEIVLPIILMAYLSQGSLQEMGNLDSIRQLLIDNGWTWMTAVCTMLFSLMHWPCSTTLLTIKKETGSIKWMILACLIPTVTGLIICFLFHSISSIAFPMS